MKRRLLLFALLFGLLFGGVTARLVALQVVESARWSDLAKRIQEEELIEISARGRIFDRNGVLLAQDLPAVSIALDNYHMSQPEVLIEILQRRLGLSDAVLAEKVYKEGYFTWIQRQVDLDVARAIEAEARQRGALGLIFIDEPKRVYPQRTLASNVIGFTGVDHRGLEGAELAFERWLSGADAVVHVQRTGTGIELQRVLKSDGGPGADVTLTLDARFQHLAEQKLDEGVRTFSAKDGFAIVLDPHTGGVLAMAQAKRFDLNHYEKSPANARLNQAVARAYEPGSLFKVFTGLAALETQAVGLGDRFDGDRKVRIAGHAFGNAEAGHKFGMVTLKDIIQNSINIGMIQVAQRVGQQNLYRYLKHIGIGQPTGVELPGELPGSLIPVERWSPLEIGAVAIGQAVTVTGLQLASRLAALANEGRIMQPHLMLAARDAKGNLLERAHPRSSGRVASLLNTQLMRQMMEAVVEAGTGIDARLDGFSAAAKSGTAQKVVPGEAGYSSSKYISSFGGFFPADDPQYFILVVLDEVADWKGRTGPWGGFTAGSVFKQIAEGLIKLEKMYPKRP